MSYAKSQDLSQPVGASCQQLQKQQQQQKQQQLQQHSSLLSSIGILRKQLDAKIFAAKQQLEHCSRQRSNRQLVDSGLATPAGASCSQQTATPHRSRVASERRELRNKLAKVRLNFDLLLARQRCLQERRKLDGLQQRRRRLLLANVDVHKVATARPQFGSPGVACKRLSRTGLSLKYRKMIAPKRYSRKAEGTPGKYCWRPHSREMDVTSSARKAVLLAQRATPVVLRSRSLIQRAKLRLRKRSEYCLFYCRFGHCSKGAACQYLHDAKRVAICKRFLRNGGACPDPSCRLSHCLDPAKLPHCEFDLGADAAGCARPGCPFGHAAKKPAPDAPACRDFSRWGHCPRGLACPHRHVWPRRLAPRRASSSRGADDEPSVGSEAAAPAAAAAAAVAAVVPAAPSSRCPAYIPVPSFLDDEDYDDPG